MLIRVHPVLLLVHVDTTLLLGGGGIGAGRMLGGKKSSCSKLLRNGLLMSIDVASEETAGGCCTEILG